MGIIQYMAVLAIFGLNLRFFSFKKEILEVCDYLHGTPLKFLLFGFFRLTMSATALP